MISTCKRTELKKWRFGFDQQDYGESHGWSAEDYDDSCWKEVETYCPWDNYAEAMKNYEGIGWFRTTFEGVAAGKKTILHFDGIGGTAKVYVNGHYVGGTENRYLPFDVDASLFARTGGKINSVAVKVDNSFRGAEHITGSRRIEWVLYGGLTHHIYVLEEETVRIETMFVKAEADGTCSVKVLIINNTSEEVSGTVRFRIEGLEDIAGEQPFTLPPDDKKSNVNFSMKYDGVQTWSPDAPNLYDVKAELLLDGTVTHTVCDRIGFRTVEVKGTDIYLNGEKIVIKGANRYDEYSPYGSCPPYELIRKDLQQMKDCGMNLVRTHYCQDPEHYRIADEIGLFYMLEVPLNWYGPPEDAVVNDFPILQAEAMDNLDRMFTNFCNHPSWIFWSTGNECHHEKKAVHDMFLRVADRMRSYNSGRLITYACNRPIHDSEELAFCDVISLNLYCGSMEDTLDDMVEGLKAMKERLNCAQEFYPDKPHMMTEYGVISVLGTHSNGFEVRTSEELAANYLEKALEVILSDDQMKGLIIWSWADYFHRYSFVMERLKGIHIRAPYGPYGIVTNDRQIKKAPYETIKRIYNEFSAK